MISKQTSPPGYSFFCDMFTVYSPSVSYHQPLGKCKLLISPKAQIFLKICPPSEKGGIMTNSNEIPVIW